MGISNNNELLVTSRGVSRAADKIRLPLVRLAGAAITTGLAATKDCVYSIGR
jgi:hypothetical protein